MTCTGWQRWQGYVDGDWGEALTVKSRCCPCRRETLRVQDDGGQDTYEDGRGKTRGNGKPCTKCPW